MATRLQELNRKRGELMFRFRGAISNLYGLLYCKPVSAEAQTQIKASIAQVEAAFDTVLVDIDRNIYLHKQYLYLTGKRCNCCNSRKVRTKQVDSNTDNEFHVECADCGHEWLASTDVKDQSK